MSASTASSEMMPPAADWLTFIKASRDETPMPADEARQSSSSVPLGTGVSVGIFGLGRRPDPLPPPDINEELQILDLVAHSGKYSRATCKSMTVAPLSGFTAKPWRIWGAVAAPPIAGSVDDLQSAGTVTAVVTALRRRSLDRIADRIKELAAPDHDEPDPPEIDLDSLKRAVAVVLEHRQWGEPEITLRDDRYLHLAWALKDDGRVAISFIPQGRVRFSVLSAPTTVPGFLNVGGRHLQQPAIGILDWFFASSHDR
jgi:hypothetical protein